MQQAVGVVEQAVEEKAGESDRCPLCGSAAFVRGVVSPIDPMSLVDTRYGRSRRCTECDYRWIWPRPAPAEVPQFYDVPGYYTHGAGVDDKAGAQGLMEKLRIHLAWRFGMRGSVELGAARIHEAVGGTSSKICDLGCGDGELGRALKSLGHDVWGVEIDPVARKRAQDAGLQVHEGTAEEVPDEVRRQGASFDVVTMKHVLEHCLDPLTALVNARSLLREGGWLFADVPNNACLAARMFGPSWLHFDAPRHLQFFTPATLKAFVEKASFQVEGTTYRWFCEQFTNLRIKNERKIWEAVRKHDPQAWSGPAPSEASSWWLLIRSLLADPSSRFAAVCVVARKRT